MTGETTHPPSDSVLVLVVDDEPMVARVFARLLAKAEYRVETSGSGTEALARLEGGLRPAALVCDVTMPEMDGMEFATRVRAMGLTVPIVFVSGYTTHDMALALHRVAPAEYLTKPEGVRDIARTVGSMLAACG